MKSKSQEELFDDINDLYDNWDTFASSTRSETDLGVIKEKFIEMRQTMWQIIDDIDDWEQAQRVAVDGPWWENKEFSQIVRAVNKVTDGGDHEKLHRLQDLIAGIDSCLNKPTRDSLNSM